MAKKDAKMSGGSHGGADRATMLAAIRDAGVVGAGGAGFPTWKKLDAAVSAIIANGAECEPLLQVDQQLMARYASEVVRGVEIAMELTGAERGVIAVKAKYKPALAALRRALDAYDDDAAGTDNGTGTGAITIFELQNFYPAGDEQVLVYETTGRIVPEGGIPLAVDAVVNNIATLINVARAVDGGEPVISRELTVVGEVRRPISVKAPVGTPLIRLLDAAGGATVTPFAALLGGPMMGEVLTPEELEERGVTKTDAGLIVLPADHYLITVKNAPITKKVKDTMAACIRCNLCTEVCPRNLLGHALDPAKIMRTIAWGNTERTDVLTGAYLCCECGACTHYGCVMGLDPCKMNIELKAKLAEAGVENPHHRDGAELEVHPYRELRKLPLVRLKGRIGILQYDRAAPLQPPLVDIRTVRIPLQQHIGAPAQPTVRRGDRVAEGDMIGRIPEGALGAPIHASIDGTITAVTADAIVIDNERGDEGGAGR